MQRATALLMVLALIALLAGCDGNNEDTDESPPPVEENGDEEDPLTCVFTDRDDAVYSPDGFVSPGDRAYRGGRYAMEMEPINSGRIGIFDRDTEELLVEIAALPEGETNTLKGIAASPDGALLAVVYHANGGSQVSLYDTETGEMALRLEVDGYMHFTVFSEDGSELYLSFDGIAVDRTVSVTADEVPITISDTEGGSE